MSKVEQIMTRSFPVISSQDSVAEASRRMRYLYIKAVAVCDADIFMGLITDSDIVSKTIANGDDPIVQIAASLITAPGLTVSSGTPVERAAKDMASAGIDLLPVTGKSGRLLGVITLFDLARESLALASMILYKQQQAYRFGLHIEVLSGLLSNEAQYQQKGVY